MGTVDEVDMWLDGVRECLHTSKTKILHLRV